MSDETTKVLSLPVRLTPSEIQSRALEAAELMLEVDTAEDAEADRRRDVKASIGARKRRLRDLSCIVREGAENRPVECDEVTSVGRALVEIFRRDTGELVYSRPMSEGEQREAAQASLWDVEGPKVTKTTVAVVPSSER